LASSFLPAGLVALPLVGLLRAARDRAGEGGFVITMALGAFNATYANDFAYQVGLAIASETPPEGRVVIEGHDWSPDFLYYARRKGLMWRGSIAEASPEVQARLLASDNFTTLVCFNHMSYTARFWPHRAFAGRIGPVTIYKVWR
jgi:hypothetical protein